jgi:mevalonate kinase
MTEERAKMFLEISKEYRECFERIIEIVQLLKAPECDSKDELIREIGELVDRIHELNLKLGISEVKDE